MGKQKIKKDSTDYSGPCCAVCLAAFDGVLWLDEQLDSILSQKGVNVRILVSIDPSSDGTEELITRRISEDNRIVLLPQKRKFGNAARNFYRLLRDVDFSDCEYVALADQDDIWLPDKLSVAVSRMQRGGYDAYSSNVVAFWPDGQKKIINKAQKMRAYDFLFEAAGPGASYVFSSSLARELQRFVTSNSADVNEVALHDWLFYAFSRSQGYRWFIDSRPGFLYRQHSANHLGANSGFVAFKNRLRRVSSGWYRLEISKIAKLCCSPGDSFCQQIRTKSWRTRWFLMWHIGQCRRRYLDRVIFFICCLFGLF